jgi:excisionase family DNA binding protein
MRPVSEPTSNLFTVPEAALYLKVVAATIRKWSFQKRFPTGYLGRRVVFRRSDLDAFIAEGFVPVPTKKAKRVKL